VVCKALSVNLERVTQVWADGTVRTADLSPTRPAAIESPRAVVPQAPCPLFSTACSIRNKRTCCAPHILLIICTRGVEDDFSSAEGPYIPGNGTFRSLR
jgi:hypothetical protein